MQRVRRSDVSRNHAPMPARWHAAGLLVVWGAVIALALALTLQRVDDVDFWWQVKTGEYIARHGLPLGDVLTYTRAGTPRIESSWLYCLALYLGFTHLGVGTLIIVKSILVMVTFALVLFATRAPWRLALAAIAAVALIASCGRFAARPEVVSYALVALFIAVLSSCRTGRERLMWILPPVTALWANLHSLFPLGLAIVGLWAGSAALDLSRAKLLGEKTDPAVRSRAARGALLFALCIGATLINPFGASLLSVPFHQFAGFYTWDRAVIVATSALVAGALFSAALLIGRFAPQVSRMLCAVRESRDNRAAAVAVRVAAVACLAAPALLSALAAAPPSVAAPVSGAEKAFIAELATPMDLDHGTPGLLFATVLLGAVVVAVLARPRSVGLFPLLLCSAGLALAVAAVRNVEFFVIAAIPCMARALPLRAPVPRGRLLARLASGLPWAFGVAIVMLCVSQGFDVVSGRYQDKRGLSRRVGLGVDEHTLPSDAATFLRESGIGGHVFNTQSLGSYLAWTGLPVFIDSRGVSGIIGEYRAITESPSLEPLEEAAARYDIRALCIGTDSPAVIARLHARPAWRPVFADATAVVYFRQGEAPQIPTVDFGPSWSSKALARLNGAVSSDRHSWLFGSWLGRVWFADSWYGRAATPIQFRRLALVCMAQGRFAAAVEVLQDSRRAFPASFSGEYALGQAAMGAGNFALAAEAFGRAISHAPDDADLLLSHAVALMNSGDLARAAAVADRAARAAPRSAEARYLQGVIELGAGDADRAARLLRQAIDLDPAQARYHAMLGSALTKCARPEEAIRAFEGAHQLDPTRVSVMANLALLESSLNHPGRAHEWARQVWALKPGDPRIRKILDAPTSAGATQTP